MKKQKEITDKHMKRKETFKEMMKIREDFPFMSKGVPMDGSSFYYYALVKAPEDLKSRYGVEFVVKPVKCSRRLADKVNFTRCEKFSRSGNH